MASPAAPGLGSILLHLDATPASAVRLAVARELAERHGGTVTALFGASGDDDPRYAYSAGAALDGALGAGWREEAAANLQRASGRPPLPGERWFHVAGDSIVHGFLAEAAYADLLVLGQQPPGARGGAPAGFVDSMILESGRPALVLPSGARAAVPGRRVLVAWNASPQSARALASARVLLAHAESVHVAVWSRHPAAAPFSRIDIVEHLGRHGIEATLHRQGHVAHVGPSIAEMVKALNIDLVVMGCFGRSRASEWMLGGTTRWLLQQMPVPLLMAH